jgi:hypothetical protein
LEDTRELWGVIKGESIKTLQELDKNIAKLRKVSTKDSEVDQIDIEVTVGNETISAVIDCGANVDYVNEAWCKAKGFELGEGCMEGFDGRLTQMKLKEAVIPFEFQGTMMKQKFRIVRETSTDLLVLGMPWLKKINPAIDWQERTVKLRNKKAHKKARKSKQKRQDHQQDEGTQHGRGGYNKTPPKDKDEEDYQERLRETQAKLPEELREYAEVFCQRK